MSFLLTLRVILYANSNNTSWDFRLLLVETLEIGVEVDIFGAHIFNLFGNLRDGVIGRINLALANGEIKFLLKNENGILKHPAFHRLRYMLTTAISRGLGSSPFGCCV